MGKLTWDPTEENQKNLAKEFFFFSSSKRLAEVVFSMREIRKAIL